MSTQWRRRFETSIRRGERVPRGAATAREYLAAAKGELEPTFG
ncbi:MAG: hypothetical protein AAF604_18285 [Acidobacteriota bacterium]